MQRKSFTLGLLGTIFILPLLIAFGVYFFQDKIHFKLNHHGTLFEPAIPVELKTDPLTAHWYLIYIKPNACQATCQQSIAVLQGIHSMLGEKSVRVRKKLIAEDQLSISLPNKHLAIIDPHHNLVLLYSESTLLSSPRDIFSDLKKLLRVSQIG